MTARYVLGIDLGTTNSVIAYTPLDAEQPVVQTLPVPQLVAAGTVESLGSLASFVFLGREHEIGQGTFDLPWAEGRDFAVGELARRQSAEVPERTVGAAKSWLCHGRVDRRGDILPWNAPAGVPKISPVAASRRYLEHLIAAWDQAFPEAPMEEQLVVLTVPASFDAAARELTREAALAAGLPGNLLLLEEPQAAVYAWLDSLGNRWRRSLQLNDMLLVCDVGGGTSDFTLVKVGEEKGELILQREAVGNHLLVGGDNMDLTLAYHAAEVFGNKGVKLDPWQSVSLWHACRTAKETLLAADAPNSHTISVLGRGSKLIGGTVSIEMKRKQALEILVDGFFPRCAIGDRPVRRRASGFQDIGLPFEQDTAVTRHLAAFLQDHGAGQGGAVQPTHVLLNGGVFKAKALADRLMQVLADWADGQKPKYLEGKPDLDNAVSRGAAYYGWAKHRGGVRIRGGTARAYYVGIETAGLAIPGAPRPLRALCVAPLGMEEGDQADVPSQEIGLVVGEPAHFRFFSSPTRKQDKVGDVLPSWGEEELAETDSMEATLDADEAIEEPYVPVKFQSRVTELGVFELWCVSTKSKKKWKLEFSVREED
ncbi:MAG TPA: Hsp70 family protein [Candidatus Anammoximicrobium sp.]|nr:Hsp70 family protein [Candidatus Anammoximicrobium sp.]